MTFGEYIDLVNYIENENSIYINIHKICAILYRPVLNKTDKKYEIEPYDISRHDEISEEFKNLPLQYFFGIFNNLFVYFSQIRKDFEVLFAEDKLDLPQDKDETPEDEKSNLPWYKMIMVLAAEDFTKIDYVTARPLVECFNHLTYITIKNETLRQQQQEARNKQNAFSYE
jgi:predicted ATP-grasp superfamily ATP-dependent carboligase